MGDDGLFQPLDSYPVSGETTPANDGEDRPSAPGPSAPGEPGPPEGDMETLFRPLDVPDLVDGVGPPPWQKNNVRPDMVKPTALRLSEPLKLKLNWLKEQGVIRSQMSFMTEVVQSAANAAIASLLKGQFGMSDLDIQAFLKEPEKPRI